MFACEGLLTAFWTCPGILKIDDTPPPNAHQEMTPDEIQPIHALEFRPTPHPMPSDSSETVPVILSKPQALVLFEFLSRFAEEERLEIRDPAEQRVLWDLLAELESALPEPLAHDYDELLQKARESVCTSLDGGKTE